MPPNKAAAPAWQGAPPVSEDGFAFVNGDFFADASGQNQHRRATVAEIKEHFTSGSDRDHPAHWFEAQLIHYGLKPTKAKAVGRMRLLDASKDGKLTVPPSITQLESKLKKEWIKKDREAKKALKGTSVPETKAAGVKRKAGDNASVNDPPAKKAKTTTAKAKAALKEKPKPVAKTATPKAKAAPKAATASASKAKAKPVAKTTKTATPKTEAVPKATSSAARRGTLSQGPGRSTPSTLPSPAPVPQPRPIQTARRSGAFMARGRIPAPVAQPAWGDGYARYDDNRHSPFNESPPPYTEYDDDDDDDDDDGDDTYGHDVTLRPLGLINGSYGITSSYVTSEWSCYGSDFDLELRLAGNSLWGRFDFGVVEGVMYFERRPRAASRDSVPFIWRGREDQGPIIYGDHNSGWLTFLGDGRIEGSIDYQRLNFRGRRAPDEGTGGGTSVYTLENEWDGYSEDRYENERVSRWR
ncbi:hypothetical protein EDB80DRAFT_88010 [Ilyonectria destructans]|nr:hypothetical protein EDB80DRAFT_88010 [Ilyonectria destructans]